MLNKKCRICNIELNDDNWSLSYQKYHSNICKKCDKYKRELYHKNHKIERKKYEDEYYHKNHERICHKSKKYCDNLKLIVFNYYSNNIIQCNCCGEKHIEFLQIDHINCGRIIHGKNKRNNELCGPKLYRWLIKNNFPEGYQVLCANCNFSKGVFGKCPHQNESYL